MSEENDRLQHLMARYREACPDLEPSAAFMPGLWDRIEARRSFSFRLRGYARVIAAAATTVCFAIAILQLAPLGRNPMYERTYVEALEADHAPETMALADIMAEESAFK